MMTETVISTNPATGEVLWQGKAADAAAVDAAVRAAHDAQVRWNMLGLTGRLVIMERFRIAVEDRRDQLATLIAKETGKPLWDAAGEVNAVIGKLAISVEAYQKRTGKHQTEVSGVRQELRHRPHGVMAVFGPYNFPAHLPNGHMIPALLAGNTVVFKPSEQTPAVGEWLAQLWQDVGMPEGVVTVVQGGKETGQALVDHPLLSGVLFTGSYATGKAIHQALAGRPEVMLALEMGGNNPLVVWQAADVKAAAKLVVHSAYISSGQRCTCARRLIVREGSEGDALIKTLIDMLPKLIIGPYTQKPEPFMGPVISNDQATLVLKAEAKLIAHGGKRLMSVSRVQENLPFLTPGLIDVTGLSERPDEEYFGPLLQIIRVPDFESALKEANHTQYGLAAGLISDNIANWKLFLAVVRAGIVNWNRPTTGASSTAPFGGVGRSGNLRPAAYYAADYCAYPLATLASNTVSAPADVPGMG